MLVALALPASAAASGAPPVEGSARISNERTLTRWAHPVQRAPIRWQPTLHARRIARTQLLTEDGFPEVYLALRTWTDPGGGLWRQLRIPGRPNGRIGWVRDAALGPLYRVRTQLVVDRRRLRATLFKKGRRIWSTPVGVGKQSTPTPGGHFWIREKFKTQSAGGIYGPMAFGTSDYSVLSDWPGGGVIGIHGTDEPSLIPGRPSHGCIRVPNPAVRRLWRLLPIGTPLLIR
jgi:L,D-transpeptidase catalytic domain